MNLLFKNEQKESAELRCLCGSTEVHVKNPCLNIEKHDCICLVCQEQFIVDGLPGMHVSERARKIGFEIARLQLPNQIADADCQALADGYWTHIIQRHLNAYLKDQT